MVSEQPALNPSNQVRHCVSDEENSSPPLPLGYVIFAFAIFLTVISPLNDVALMPPDFSIRDLNAWTASATRLLDLIDFILLRSALIISLVRLPPLCTLVGLLVLIPATNPISDTQGQSRFRIAFVIFSIAVGLFAIAMLVKSCQPVLLSASEQNQNEPTESANSLDGPRKREEGNQITAGSPLSSSDTITSGNWSNQSRGLDSGLMSWEEAKPGMPPMTPDDDVLRQMMEAMM